MSTGGPTDDAASGRGLRAVLLSLWRRPETTMPELLRATLAPLPEVQRALEILQQRRCLIEWNPAGIRLVATGLGCWREVLEEVSREKGLRVGRRVMVFARTGSTNDVAWQCASGGEGGGGEENDGLVVVADEQSAGRGRFGHAWAAKAEQSVLCSVLLRDVPGESVDRLTLAAGLAAARAIESALGPTRAEIKWPNDILVRGKKIAGVLVERRGTDSVVGVGANVAQAAEDFAGELAHRATSVYRETGLLVDRLRIVAALLAELDALVAAPANDAWHGEWKSRCSMLGTRIAARSGERVFRGVVLDVDPLRGLLMRDDAGATHFLSAQTTTLAL